MREFFRGWRRKAGCVTLVTACVFVAAWGRHLVFQDRIDIPVGDSIIWAIALIDDGILFTEYTNIELTPGTFLYRHNDSIVIPYWSTIIPLTAISAWLLLSKPRKTPAVPADEVA
jgi:hypothetical protein